MKNLFKKLLACCLALCMVLTLCVGALTVSAEDVVYDGTFTIVGDEVTTDDASAVVNYTAQADCGIAAAEINVDIPDGFAIDELELITEDENVEALFAKSADSTEAPEAIYAGDVYGDEEGETLTDVGDVFTYLIRVYADEVEASTAAITLEITYVPTGEKFEVGNHAVTADIESCKNATDPLLNLEVTLTAEIVVTEAHTHNYVGAVTKEATCTEAGVMTYTCTCGEGTYTEEIPVIPHTEETIPAVDATCTTAGSTAGVKCSVCDTVITAPEVIEATGHAWDEGEVTTAPDCDDAGVKTYTCANDPSHTKEEAIDALGHTPAAETVKKDEVAATCTTAGSYRNVVVCAVCDAEISSETVTVDALGHNYGTPVDNGDGTHTATCANNCGIDLTEDCAYVDLVCECGDEKEQNVALEDSLYSTAMTVGEKFGIYRCFWLEKITDIEYDDFEIVVSKRALDGSSYLYTEQPVTFVFDETNCETKSNISRQLYYYNYNQVSLYELGVEVIYTLYLYEDGKKVEYYSFEPVTFVTIAKAHYDKYLPTVSNESSLKQVKMGASLLKVAAAAQEYFKTKNEDSPLHDFADPLVDVDEQYVADYSTLTALQSPTQDSKFKLMGLRILATPSFRYYYYNTSSKTPAELTLSASYQSLNTNLGEEGLVTKSLNGDNLPGTDGDKGATNGLYYYTFDQIALYDGDKPITLTATDATGTYTFVTSLDTFLVNNITVSGETGDVYRAIASLSACSRIYFPSY